MKNLRFATLAFVFVLLSMSCSKEDTPEKVAEVPQQENRAPVINSQSFTTPEDTSVEVTIGTVTATDPDGDVLTFNIVTNSNDLFEITSTGVLSLADNKSLDFETAQSHEITVMATDGDLSSEAVITINVGDVEDSEPGSLAFITSWKTTTVSETIEIPIGVSGLVYNYQVDWGDGAVSTGVTGKATHVYETPGTYDVAITGKFPAINFGYALEENTQIQDIKQWGNISWESFHNAFYLCTVLEVSATDKPDLSMVTDFSGMFGYTKITNPDLSDWDLSKATTTSYMFQFASLFNSDISAWNVSNVTTMAGMFNGASAFNANLNAWDVSKVTNFNQTFSRARVFDSDLDKWDVSNVNNMINMFAGASNYNGNISTWNVSSVEDFYGMFMGAKAFNSHIGAWDVSGANVMSDMFSGAIAFNQDISNWNVSNVFDMERMFAEALAFNFSLNSWDVSNVENMMEMFLDASAFNGDISAWNVSSVTDMDSMFEGATIFNGNIGDWNVNKVIYMDRMFDGASAFDQNLGNWDISSITDMDYMLDGAGLSIANYDATLKGWAEQATVPSDINLGAQDLMYCAVGETARNTLTTKGWSFQGDAKSTTCK